MLHTILYADVWSADGDFERSKAAVGTVVDAGFPKHKVNMGVAFYGQGGCDFCSLKQRGGCPQLAPASNNCSGTLVDGEAMQTAMGKWYLPLAS